MEFEASENFQNQKYIHCYRQDIRDTIVTFGSEILESTDNNIVEWVDQVIQRDAEGKWRRCNIFITELLKLGGEKNDYEFLHIFSLVIRDIAEELQY